MLEETGDSVVGAELEVALRTEGGVGSDSNAELHAESDKLLLREVGVELNLVHSRLNASIAEHVEKKSSREIAYINISINKHLCRVFQSHT